MADDSPDEAHDDVDHEREPVQIRCSMSREWVETELLPAYPAVTSASQAARNACMDGVEAQQGQGGLRAEIRGEIVDVLRESGGRVENCQTITIGPEGEVVVEEDSDAPGEA